MKTHKMMNYVWISLAAMAVILAERPTAAAQDYDPPGRVARVNYAQGSVSFQPGGEGDWLEAVPNRPLTAGDNLWIDRGSRTELHVGSTAIRLGEDTSLTFLDLDDRNTQLRLSQGTMILRLRHLDDDDWFEIDTPNLAFNPKRTGQYRIDVDGDRGETRITIWKGRGEVTGGGYSYTVVAGQEARFYGTEQMRYDIAQISPYDDFDNWGFERDRREDRFESANYVSPEMTGYEDLDDYGQWRYVANYGTVWFPSGVAADWAPYRYGHWTYISPWGWTWVEDEPWGFAPFHYGRWAYAGDRWCWVPGPVAVRPVYAPALVAFVGGGPGTVLAIGGGGVGWFPLAPGEVYVPYYPVSRGYVQRVNVTNTTVNVTQVTNVYNVYTTNKNNVTQINYVNRRVNNGVTVVSHDTFVNARPVARNLERVDTRQIATAPVVQQPPVQPVRTSVLGAAAPAKAKPPAAIVNRQVVATRSPAPVKAPFEPPQPKPNVRTEQPAARPQPLPAQGTGTAGKEEPTARSQNQAQEPSAAQPGNRQQEPANRNVPQRPTKPERPQQPAQGQRPDTARPAPQATPPTPAPREAEPQRPERNVPRPPEPTENQNERRSNEERSRQNNRPPENWSHPLARPAPSVQEKSPSQRQEDENKFRTWQQQREQQRSQEGNRPEQANRPPQPGRPEQANRPPQPNRAEQANRPDKKNPPSPAEQPPEKRKPRPEDQPPPPPNR